MKIISFLTFESGEGETVLWSTKPISDVYFLLLGGGDTMSGPNCKNSRRNSFKNYLFGIFRLHPSSFILGQRDAWEKERYKKKNVLEMNIYVTSIRIVKEKKSTTKASHELLFLEIVSTSAEFCLEVRGISEFLFA